jgi:hypothetical protein
MTEDRSIRVEDLLATYSPPETEPVGDTATELEIAWSDITGEPLPEPERDKPDDPDVTFESLERTDRRGAVRAGD